MRITVKGILVEVRYREVWYDHKIIFYSDPGDLKYDIIQYLYSEGFIQDRRTPYVIKDIA